MWFGNYGYIRHGYLTDRNYCPSASITKYGQFNHMGHENGTKNHNKLITTETMDIPSDILFNQSQPFRYEEVIHLIYGMGYFV